MRGLIAFPGKNRLRLATTLATTLGLFAFSACSSAAEDAELAPAFTDYVLSDAGQKVLADAGFDKP